MYTALSGLVDFDAERVRLRKQLDRLSSDNERLTKKLANPGFLAKAAPEVIEKDRAKQAETLEQIERVQAQLDELA